LLARSPPHGLGKTADEQIRLVILHEHAPGLRVVNHLLGIHDPQRHGKARRRIGNGNADTLLPYVKPQDSHTYG